MARTRTLVQLVAEVRDRADIEGSLHITDTQIKRYINQSAAALHAEMVDLNEDYFSMIESGVLPAGGATGTSLTPTATNVYKPLWLQLTLSGRVMRLRRWTHEERAALLNAGVGGGRPRYRFFGEKALIVPSPSTAGGEAYALGYVPAFVDLSGDSDTLDGRDGYEEWVVLDAAIKCMAKEESDTTALVRERAEAWARIKRTIPARDLGAPETVGDVEAADIAWPFPAPFGG